MGRVWEPGEPWFLDQDTTAVLDWFDYQNSLCDGCGEPKMRSFAPEHEHSYRATVFECHACSAKARAAKKIDADGPLYVVAEFKA